MKLGLIQAEQKAADGYRERCDQLLKAAEECFYEGADLVFFPEAFQRVPDRGVIHRTRELEDSYREWHERCAALAKRFRAYLVPWDYEPEDGKVCNTSYILDRTGREIGKYRKVHLTYGEQRNGITPGDDFPVFDLDCGRIGIMTCWDNYFPESARILGNRGAELILYPLYGDTLKPQWELKLRVRAIDSAVFIAPEQIDCRFDTAYTGLVGPDGTVLHRLTRPGSHLVAEFDPGERVLTHTSGNNRVTEDLSAYTARCRRPDVYRALTETYPTRDWDEILQSEPSQT